MAGGSKTREDPTDQRCEHCALFYSSQGIATHEPNCPIADLDVDVVPAAESQGLSEEAESETVSTDGEDQGGSPEVDPEPSPREAVTDGGATGLGLGGPPAQPSSAADDDGDLQDDEDVDVDDETYDCTECGTDTGYSDDDLDSAFSETTDRHGFRGYINCDDCGKRMGWSA